MRSPDQTVGPWSGKRGGLIYPGFGGRLTLTTATPVTTSDVTAATALYYTEHLSDLVTLPWRRGKWETFPLPKNSAGIAEIKAAFLANSPWALANATAYDVFLKLGVGGPELVRGPAWSSATARSTGLARVGGILTLATNPLMVWVGTIYASAANQCEDSTSKRFVWNARHQVPRPLKVVDATNSWTYGTADTWRQANASAANAVYVLFGDTLCVRASVLGFVSTAASATYAAVGVGIDSTTVNSAQVFGCINTITPSLPMRTTAEFSGHVVAGYHAVNWLEIQNIGSALTWYGDNGVVEMQSGLVAEVMG